jgi:hypothetical protein
MLAPLILSWAISWPVIKIAAWAVSIVIVRSHL